MTKETMTIAEEQEVSKWIQQHERDMICCPHQPGLLLISKRSCLKRYRAAVARVFENVSQEDPFHYTLKKGFSLCEGCPIGKKLDAEDRGQPSQASGKRSVSASR